MMYIAPRDCAELDVPPSRNSHRVARPIANYREMAAFVMLGDPGMGKSTVFKQEANATSDGLYITARDFVCLEPKTIWKDPVLFVDGLDEFRAGNKEGRSVWDKVRRRLDQLGRPRFRISCRLASWYGSNDRKHLGQVSPDGSVHVLTLAPLPDSEINKILGADSRIDDVNVFRDAADSAGLSKLITNPLNLKLLAELSNADGLPRTRRELMEWTCDVLLRECNDEHQIAPRGLPAHELLLNRAGYLSALLIFADSAGYSLASESDPRFLTLNDVHNSSADRYVIGSRLFREEAECLFVPQHCNLIEFLAAKYVAGRLSAGLPVNRLASLMKGLDGRIQPVFHGFLAWLSELCPVNRADLIKMEPAGIASNADVGGFEQHEKLLMIMELLSLAERYPPFLQGILANRNLGTLVAADDASEVVGLLSDLRPCEEHQPRAIALAELLRQAAPIPSTAPPLLEMVRDSRWSRQVRMQALRAAVHQKGEEASDVLAELADEIRRGLVSDDSDDILGFILPKLYPHTLKPRAVVQYLHTPRGRAHASAKSYLHFWADAVKAHGSPVELLNALVDRHNELLNPNERTAQTVREVMLIVLGHFLPTQTPAVSTHQLFNWIGTAALSLNSRTYEFGVCQEEQQIRTFLEAKPDVRSALARLRAEQSHHAEASRLDPLLFLTAAPQNAHSLDVDDSRVGEDSSVMSLEEGQSAASRTNLNGLEALLLAGNGDQHQVPTREFTDFGQQVLMHVRKQTSDAKAGTGKIPPELLHQIAAAYHGIGEEAQGRTPHYRLQHLLGSDQNIIEYVLSEFRYTALDSEFPDEREILRLTKQNRLHLSVLPCLAGLSEMSDAQRLNDAQLRRAIAVYFTTRRFIIGPGEDLPRWFKRAVEEHYALVAEVYVRFAAASWAASRFPPAELTRLIYEKKYARVARLIVLPLLKKLSVRSSHIHSLMHLLHGALQLSSREELADTIEGKLSAASMTNVQRVWWLVAGLCNAPEVYAELLEVFVKGNQLRVEHLVKAIRRFENVGMRKLPAKTTGLLVQLTAPWHEPPQLMEPSPSTALGAGALIEKLLQTLGDWPSEEALDTLKHLESEPALCRWHQLIHLIASRQRAHLNTWVSRNPGAGTVADVLANRTPANVQDLMALTVDTLENLAREIRTGNWRQFWDVDSWGRPKRPKPENSCRDALASDLKHKLCPWNISVHVEAVHTNGTRSDILICYKNYSIPIEIKKSCHPELWNAMQTQLIGKYCTNPDSHGFGLYVVFWFGNIPDCRPTRGIGSDLQSAEELESSLADTLSESDRHRVAVVIIDVSQVGIRATPGNC